MAPDGTQLNLGTGGNIMDSDEVAGKHLQRIKLVHGADDSNAGDVAVGNPLPVVQTGTLNVGTVTTVTTVSAVTAISNALPAGNNNIGDVDVASIAAGDNNIGNVDIASIAAGDNNIGNVDIVTLPALAAGTNAIGTVTTTRTSLTASAPTANTVGVASAEAVAANASRKGLILTNTSVNRISFAVGAAAVLDSGITLLPGGTWTMDEYTFTTGQIRAIASAASSNLAIQELT